MKVWITKYALSRGILEKEVEKVESNPTMVRVMGNQNEYYHGENRDWHTTKLGAKIKADSMVMAKLNSLQRQMIKLKKIEF